MSCRLFVKNLPKNITKDQLVLHIQKTCPGVEVTDCNLKFTPDGIFRRFAFVGFSTEADTQKTQTKLNGTFITTTKIQVDIASDNFGGSNKTQWTNKGKHIPAKNVKEKVSKPDNTPSTGLVIKMKGFTGFVSEKAVQDFFKPIKPLKIRLPRNAQKKPMGVAFVEFSCEKDLEQAMGRNKNFINGKKIFLKKSQEEVQEKKSPVPATWAVKAQDSSEIVESIGESGLLFVRNLWFGVTEEELQELFGKFGPLHELTLPVDPLTKKVKGFAHIVYVFPEHALKAYTELDYYSLHGRLMHILPGKENNTDSVSNEKSSFKKKKDLEQKAKGSSSYNWNSLFLGANAVADAMAKKYDTDKSRILDSDAKGSVGVRMALGETQIVAETRDFLLSNGVVLDSFSQAAGERSKTVILVKNLPASVTSEELRDIFSKHGSLARVVVPPSGITALVEYLEPSEAKKGFTKLNFSRFYSFPLYLEWAPTGVFSTPAPTPVPEKTQESKKKDKEESKKKEEKSKEKESVAEAMEEEEDDDAPVEEDDESSEEEEESEEDDESSQEEEESEEDESKTEKKDTIVESDNNNEKKETKKVEDDEDVEQEPEEGSTLFVKNLNFDTTDEQLNKHFSNFNLYSATVAKKKDAKRPGEILSMGYGFVQFMTQADAKEAIKMLQNSQLDGHKLELRLSTRPASQSSGRQKQNVTKQTSSKILVRNIPFEANKREIEELFKVFGELKFVRLPKKLKGTGPHRGFAFVDFITKADAKRAFNALCHSTHLYGRRLVLEWAQAEESLDELRRKTAQHFNEDGPKKKMSKMSLMKELE